MVTPSGDSGQQSKTYEFSDKTLKLKDFGGRSIRLVENGDGKVTIKADSLLYRMFHKEKYASSKELIEIVNNIPHNDEQSTRTAKLFLQRFTPLNEDAVMAFMKGFQELYGNETPFSSLDLSTSPGKAYNFLLDAGALKGDGRKLEEYVKKLLLSGYDLDDVFKNKKLLDNIAEAAFNKLM